MFLNGQKFKQFNGFVCAFIPINEFLKIYILQNSVAMQFMCGRIFHNHVIKMFTECASERTLKIGQYPAKI